MDNFLAFIFGGLFADRMSRGGSNHSICRWCPDNIRYTRGRWIHKSTGKEYVDRGLAGNHPALPDRGADGELVR